MANTSPSNVSTLALTEVESVQNTNIVTGEAKIFQSLNLRLQVKVHNLETEVGRMKTELLSYKGKTKLYESLTKDLASLRKQFDKTAVALLKKCEAYEELKKQVDALKAKSAKSPRAIATPIRPTKLIPVNSALKKRLTLSLFREADSMDFSSDDETPYTSRGGRPSMGSCGNISKQIASEEAMPSRLKAYAAPSAPLRNRVLMKLHTIKSASTESLESQGRKSIRSEEKEKARSKPTKPVGIPVKKPKPILNASSENSKLTPTPTTRVTPQPSYRPALGHSNSHRMIRVTNIAAVKRSNSNTSTKSASSYKPAFKF